MGGLTWSGLTLGAYRTIVVDPPWPYEVSGPPNPHKDAEAKGYDITYWKVSGDEPMPYTLMSVDDIAKLPVAELGHDEGSRVFVWTTNRYLFDTPGIIREWGYEPGKRVFVWCKPPMGTLNVSTEFFLVGKRGSPSRLPWCQTTWFRWDRVPGRIHSAKPAAFMDLVEQWSPAPYVELFARQPRLGWDSWGWGYEDVP